MTLSRATKAQLLDQIQQAEASTAADRYRVSQAEEQLQTAAAVMVALFLLWVAF